MSFRDRFFNREPEATPNYPCPFDIGDTVYPVSKTKSEHHGFGYQLKWDAMGAAHTVVDVRWKPVNRWASSDSKGYWMIFISAETPRLCYSIHEGDLCYENTWEDPYVDMPAWLHEALDSIRGLDYGRYNCRYVVYREGEKDIYNARTKKQKNDLWNYFMRHGAIEEYDEYYEDDFYDEEEYQEYLDNRGYDMIPQEPMAIRNVEDACWASTMRLISNVYDQHRVHPNRLLNYVEYPSPAKIETVRKFYKMCKKARLLPHSWRLPSLKELENPTPNDPLIMILNFEGMSKEQLYLRLCTMRLPWEYPQIITLAVHYYEQGGMDPLMSYIMGHVMHPAFCGGHAAMDGGANYTESYSDNSRPIPRMTEVVGVALKFRRLILDRTVKKIEDFTDSWELGRDWNFSTTIYNYELNYKVPDELTVDTLPLFDVATRKLAA